MKFYCVRPIVGCKKRGQVQGTGPVPIVFGTLVAMNGYVIRENLEHIMTDPDLEATALTTYRHS